MLDKDLRLNLLGRNSWIIFMIILLTVGWVLSIIRTPEIFQSESILNANNNNSKEFSLVIPISDDFCKSLDSNFYIQIRVQDYPYQEYGYVLSSFELTVDRNSLKKTIRLTGINQFVTTSKNKKIGLKSFMKVDAIIFKNDLTLLKKLRKKFSM